MLKFVFGALLLANLLLFALHQDALDALVPSGREPARLLNQLNADKLRLVRPPPDGALAAAAPAAREAVEACVEIGSFNLADAARFEARLAELGLNDKLARREVEVAQNHMVMIPPAEIKDGVAQQVAELRKLGIAEFFVIQDNSPRRGGISLGMFKNGESARTHLAAMARQGVRNARVVEYNAGASRVAFQLRALDPNARTAVERIRADFPRLESAPC